MRLRLAISALSRRLIAASCWLRSLMERPGRVMTRDQLLEDVWGTDIAVTSRTIDTHLKRLREKLGPASDLIETVRGVGYRFAE